MAFYKTEGIVLRSRPYSETDNLLTIITPTYGKVSAIAKGIRKPKSRLRGGVMLFSFSNMMLSKGKSLDIVTQAESIEPFSLLRDDYNLLHYTSYLAEVVMGLTPEAEQDERLFAIILAAWHILESTDNPILMTQMIELKLIKHLGYEPQIESCVFCGRVPQSNKIKLDVEYGGVVCENCSENNTHTKIVGREAWQILRQLYSMDLTKIHRLKVSSVAQKEMLEFLHTYLQHRLDSKIKSWSLLKVINDANLR